MALDQIQPVTTLLSYAAQEAREDIAVPIPQAIRVSSLKNYQLAMPGKPQQDQWGTQ